MRVQRPHDRANALQVVLAAALLAAAAFGPASAAESDIRAPGPNADLAGTLSEAGPGAPIVLILPGSGPTDRDGNNPLGVAAAPYRLLAEALAANGVASVRVDKRGLFGSRAAVPDPDAVTIAEYASDALAWVQAIRTRTGVRCVWLLGHSEGGLVALQAAQEPGPLCGVILVSTPGRPFGQLLREQLRANPANAPILDAALGAVDASKPGGRWTAQSCRSPSRRFSEPACRGS